MDKLCKTCGTTLALDYFQVVSTTIDKLYCCRRCIPNTHRKLIIHRRVKFCYHCRQDGDNCESCRKAIEYGACRRCDSPDLPIVRGLCHVCVRVKYRLEAEKQLEDRALLEAYKGLGSYELLADLRSRYDIEEHANELCIE